MKRFSLLIVVIFGAVLLMPPLLRYAIGRIPFVEIVRPDGNLSDMENKQIDVHLESVRLFITLATLLLGGLGLFVSVSTDDHSSVVRRELPLVYACMIFSAVSILLGQISYEMLVWMLSSQFFNPDSPAIYWARTSQHWAFLVSVAFFGVFFVKAMK